MNLDKLKEPFDPKEIKWRVGATNQKKIARETNSPKAFPTKGIALAYIDARHVMDRLDEVMGAENWKDKYYTDGSTTMCKLSLRIDDEWITKEDGAGDTKMESEKGALSDALKRAAVKWGIGRYLYAMENTWVDLDYGKISSVDLERLLGKLTNDSLTVKGPSGLSKTPAKFWSGKSLIVALPVKHNTGAEWSEEAWIWWKDKFSQGINKAPTKELLEKYWNDNDHILSKMPSHELEGYRDTWEIRLKQLEG